MKNLIIAFFAALIAILITYGVLVLIGIDKTVATSISTVILSGVPFIHQTLVKNEDNKTKAHVHQFVSIERYTFEFKIVLVYAFLLSIAAINFPSALGGVLSGIAGPGIESVGLMLGVIGLFITYPLFFFIGRWIGIKTSSNGVVVIVLAVFLSRTATSIFDFYVLSPDEYEKIFGFAPTFFAALGQSLSGTFFLSAAALIGYWRGRKRQLAAYMGYLMSQVHPDVRNTIIELAFEEAENWKKSTK
ncbi:MAG: hypothetical protein DWQ10_18310 [Calditrichaeota bacterium]|nr:MAG: hypothetical protein DWQ10_18310 [Calditrichota bacterium]